MVLVGVEEEGEAAIVLLDELEVLVVVVVVDLEEGVVVGVVVDAFLGRRRQQGSGQGRQAKCQFLGPRWQSREIRFKSLARKSFSAMPRCSKCSIFPPKRVPTC